MTYDAERRVENLFRGTGLLACARGRPVISGSTGQEACVTKTFKVSAQSQNRFEATGSGPAITILGIANFGNSLDAGFRYEEATPEVTENFSYNLPRHALKFGGSIRAIRDNQVATCFAA